MTPERIEGVHHYAEDGFLWAIKRKSDDELLEMGGGKMWAEDRVKHHDEQANHFIAQGEKQALERVDRAAEEVFASDGVGGQLADTVNGPDPSMDGDWLKYQICPVYYQDPIATGDTFTQALFSAATLSTEGA